MDPERYLNKGHAGNLTVTGNFYCPEELKFGLLSALGYCEETYDLPDIKTKSYVNENSKGNLCKLYNDLLGDICGDPYFPLPFDIDTNCSYTVDHQVSFSEPESLVFERSSPRTVRETYISDAKNICQHDEEIHEDAQSFYSSNDLDILNDLGYSKELFQLDDTHRIKNTRAPRLYSNGMSELDKANVEQSNDQESENSNYDSALMDSFYVFEGLPFKDKEGSECDETIVTINDIIVESTLSTDTEPSCETCCFDHLPIEIIQQIFSYLSLKELCLNVSLVCRKWLDLVNDPIHWTELSISSDHQVSSYLLAKLIKKSPRLRRLNLRGKFDLSAEEILFFARTCPLLVMLDFGFVVTVDPQSILYIAHHCHNLESLNIEGCVLVDNECISYMCMPGSLPKLRSLNLSHCTGVSDNGIHLLAKTKGALTSLNIDGIPWTSDSAVIELCEKAGERLQELWLDGAELTDSAIHGIVQNCHYLQLLSLSFCERLTDDSLYSIRCMPSLTALTLRKGPAFSAIGLYDAFDLEGSKLQGLTQLDLSECTQLTDDGVTALVKRCGANLTRLSLCWCWCVSDVGVEHIVESCRKLHHFDLTGLDKISGECFVLVPTQIPNLQFLDLNQCNKINDDVIVETLKRMPAYFTVIDYYGNKFEHP